MNAHQIVYLVFGIVLSVALIFDLGLLSKKNKSITIKQALNQTMFWVGLAIAFFVFLWIEGPALAADSGGADVSKHQLPFEFLSAYLMEWSLSIDNIFVFILIFNSFGVKEAYYSRVLLLGILMAIIFRVIFITLGVALVAKFSWLLYIFGGFLIYTGYHMFKANEEEQFDPHNSKIYKFLKSFLPLVNHDGGGKYMIRENGKPAYTTLFVVVILLAAIDLVFALDSIPAVMGISKDPLIIYTSNIFAVLGLRSLFFLLRGAVTKFDYLQQGIAIVLVFIGVKMLGEHYLSMWMSKTSQVALSLGVIVLCISGSILYSIVLEKRGTPKDVVDDSVK
ncbi:MAG: tellurium resistance protein TerC [Sphingobacteriia bacterium 24-36-13]|jgi:tellurite resistance protein TerC|uniref:TerC/Alx family metal homeostasis membrane protein n=2 Tax=Sediminibacterium sp. TaxID=1917865 RepID=UPI000BCFCF57|nr:TerC/Alx family metal homeostasis membrane protein [Sediminibacterium sp.]OYZ53328.1 MAG: tellurium resistance protein TerC [Sphingobacteriia bacterium 24-36-13]OZA64056.1 MAG: tellurium resistance protein TerC [Sphingobacteriia bacterium 39-36-14]HQS23144.1 TerC/Alx family metal homeostasis membrane protein [Sediminibacterium sp.]HQS34068.1 TerC/Alx family metal homeostasis membrane protein [Sediminibacterium sp.]